MDESISVPNTSLSLNEITAAINDLFWPLLVFWALFSFRKELHIIFRGLADRLRSGVILKIGAFELGALNIDRVVLLETSTGVQEDGGSRTKERNEYYATCRHLMLVHRIAHSEDDDQEFDIMVYLIPHEDKGTLSVVTKVEYFLGEFWRDKVFTSTNRHTGFPARLSAYGPTLCSAKIHFTDGGSTCVHRYLDFEMGGHAPVLENVDG